MRLFHPFLPLHPLQPGAKRGDRTLGLKKQIPSSNGDIYVHYDRGRTSAAEILFARFREADVTAGKLVSANASLKNLVKSKTGMNRGGANAPTTSNE